jgi:RNA polymerase sigma-70 factor (ECF subfamily)
MAPLRRGGAPSGAGTRRDRVREALDFVDDSSSPPPQATDRRAVRQSASGEAHVTFAADVPFVTILARARGGDKAVLGGLYRHFLPAVYRYISARVNDVLLAEDLTSDTFFAMLEGINNVRAEDELGYATWLLGIARNVVAQHFRRQGMRPTHVSTLPEQYEPTAVAEEDDPLAVLTARESWNEVEAALDQLTREQRVVLLYRLIHGYSTEEVGQALGKPANAIRGLQFRALASLARALAAQGNDHDPPLRGGRPADAPRR